MLIFGSFTFTPSPLLPQKKHIKIQQNIFAEEKNVHEQKRSSDVCEEYFACNIFVHDKRKSRINSSPYAAGHSVAYA